VEQLHRRTRRALPYVNPDGVRRSPTEWSEAEAYGRMGIKSYAQPYAANEYGGARGRLPVFAADIRNRRAEGQCTKHQHAHGALSPGLMVR